MTIAGTAETASARTMATTGGRCMGFRRSAIRLAGEETFIEETLLGIVFITRSPS
jgi:hypothetical protein